MKKDPRNLAATGVTTALREYIWAAGQVVGVFEGGQLYVIRTDHIGRPVFATNDAGAVVWSATYYPFGGVRVTQGHAHRVALSGAVVPGRIGLAPELDARLRSGEGAVSPARPAGADRRAGRLWLCAAEPDEMDGPAGGADKGRDIRLPWQTFPLRSVHHRMRE